MLMSMFYQIEFVCLIINLACPLAFSLSIQHMGISYSRNTCVFLNAKTHRLCFVVKLCVLQTQNTHISYLLDQDLMVTNKNTLKIKNDLLFTKIIQRYVLMYNM